MNSVLHQDIRAKLMAMLVANEELSFKILKQELSLSDGNLSSHLKKLQEVGYIKTTIETNEKTNKTQKSLIVTAKGVREFKDYIEELKKFIQSTQ